MSTATAERQPEIADEVVDRAEIKDGNVLVSYSKTEAVLAELKRQFAGVQFEVSTPKGDKLARDARLSLVRLRTGLESNRKAFKAPALAFGKKIDAEAERLRLEIEALERPIDAQIVAEEQRREVERQARIEAERVRVAALRERIDGIAAVARRAVGKPAAEIEAKIQLLVAQEIGPDFGDYLLEAERVHAEALGQLRELLEAAQAQEAEAQRLAAERAELDRLRAAQAEADRLERERLARRSAFETAMRQMRAHVDALYGCDSAVTRGALDAFVERGAVVDWPEFQAEADEVYAEVDTLIRRVLSSTIERERIAALQAAEAQRLADARAAQERADAEAAEARRVADAQAAAERAEQDRVAREAREAEQRRQDEAAAELRQREIDLAERIAAENRVLPEAEPGPVITAEPPGIPVHMDREHGGLAFGDAPASTEPAATMKLGAINEAFGGFLRVDAAGLERLGFQRQQRAGAGVHFLASDFPAICDALMVKIVAAKAAAVVA